jgi:hypothetical protein
MHTKNRDLVDTDKREEVESFNITEEILNSMKKQFDLNMWANHNKSLNIGEEQDFYQSELVDDPNSWTNQSNNGCEVTPFKFTCLSDNIASYYMPSLRVHDNACALFTFKPVYSIAFCGDSYIRHAFQGFILILSGDYESGSMPHNYAEECAGDQQFDEKKCRMVVKQSEKLCHGRVHVQLFEGAWCPIHADMLANFDLIMWGGGNHPANLDYGSRLGVNNAHLVGEHVLRPVCSNLDLNEVRNKVIFVLPHVRLNQVKHFDDENRDVIAQYAREIPERLGAYCQINQTVDMFSFTDSAIQTIPLRILNMMTHDSAHWSRNINVIKAWKIMDAIAQKHKINATFLSIPLLCRIHSHLCSHGKQIKSIFKYKDTFKSNSEIGVGAPRSIWVDPAVTGFWGGRPKWLGQTGLEQCSPNRCSMAQSAENADIIVHNLRLPENYNGNKINAILNFEAYGHQSNSGMNAILVSYHLESDLVATYAFGLTHAFNLCIGDPNNLRSVENQCENMQRRESPFFQWCNSEFGGDFYTCVFNVMPHITKTNAVNKSSDALGVAWISNRCNRHDDYLAELMKHIKIDSMGGCYHNKNEMEHPAWKLKDFDSIWWGANGEPPRDGNGNKKLLIASQYKFFISIENTILDDYVTEKFYEGLLADTVMVYLGAPNVHRYAPSHGSFINALDFDGPASLATYLIELAADEDKYDKFTAWRRVRPVQVQTSFKETVQNDVFRLDNRSMLCRLCSIGNI